MDKMYIFTSIYISRSRQFIDAQENKGKSQSKPKERRKLNNN